jgi:hypothetical protein
MRDAPAESLTGDFGQPDAEVEDTGVRVTPIWLPGRDTE